jgi:DNA-binding GntR family transcriptional regulator
MAVGTAGVAVPLVFRESRTDAGETLASRIRTELADAITAGRLKPGSEIDEQDVAQRFGTSRTPVREALRELAASGLVIIEPRRGVRVVEMTLECIGELFEVVAEIEAVCARFASYRMSARERAALSHLHDQARARALAGDVDGYDKVNQEFHGLIYAATHNAELHRHALALRRRVAPFRRAQFRGSHRLTSSLAEHDAILQCIFSGDGETAARLMRAHMLMAGMVYADLRP